MEYYFSVENPYKSTLIDLFEIAKKAASWNTFHTNTFVMANLIRHAFIHKGHQATIVGCYAIATNQSQNWGIGLRGMTENQDEVEGHVISIINNEILVDFDLSSVQENFDLTFPHAVAAPITSHHPLFPIELKINNGKSILWMDSQIDSTKLNQAILDHQPVAEMLYESLL